MTISAETLSFLASKGLSTNDLIEAARLLERDMSVTRVTPNVTRSVNAERQARHRLKVKAVKASVTSNVTEVTPRNVTNVTESNASEPDLARARGEVLTSLDSNISPTKSPPKGGQKGKVLSPDWQPSDEDRAYAVSRGLVGQRLERTIENFRDYWVARAGAGAAKRDWSATWRTWVRRELERTETPPARAGPQRNSRDGIGEVLDELRSRQNGTRTYDLQNSGAGESRGRHRAADGYLPFAAGDEPGGPCLDLRCADADER